MRPGLGEPEILLIDDEEDIRVSVQQALELRGHAVSAFARAERALDRLSRDFAGVVVCDIRMPRMDGLAFLEAALEIDPELPIILVTGHGDVPLAVEAVRKGAFDFIEKPFAAERLAQAVTQAADKRRLTLEIRALSDAPASDDPLEAMLWGRAPQTVALRRKLATVAATDLDVLLVGETGTGKELAARAIHALSARRERPFVALNLAALPTAGAEAELFGHVAGYLGAPRARTGRFEHAAGGTLYLDEIGSAPMALQVKLLRVLEERAIAPLGAPDNVALDVRVLASSRVPLEGLVAEGRFRDDLLYRVNPVTIALPPLRERVGDAPRLFQRMAADAARRHGREAVPVPAETLLAIGTQPWPGNLRELRNAAERFVLGLASDTVGEVTPGQTLAAMVDNFERNVLTATLAAHDGSLKATYEALGLARKTLYEKMQKHGLRREDFSD